MADQKIVPFLFEGEGLVRVADRDGMPWFMVKDACRIIGTQNPTQAVAALDGDERAMLNIAPNVSANFVSESGLYTLILRSRDATKPGTVAHRFRKWVTSEVLPALRKTGRYDVSEAEELQTADDIKLRKVNTAIRAFGERAGAQLWVKLGLEMVPAMRPVIDQLDLVEIERITITRAAA